jgi:hypothetical protein
LAHETWRATAGIASGVSLVAVCIVVLLGALPAARANEDEQRRTAAQLYAEAQSAATGGDYARAAALFEQANATLPTPQALRATVQVYLAADQPLLALARAEELLRRYPYDASSRALALETIDQHAARFVRVLVTCDAECVLQTDETRAPSEPGRSHVVYLSEGRHDISARFADGSAVTKHIRRDAGQAVSLGFERGVSPAPVPGPPATGAAEPAEPTNDDAGQILQAEVDMPAAVRPAEPTVERFLPPRLPLLAGGAVTAGLGVAAVLSHRDAVALEQSAVDASGAQLRTSILVGATALSAAATVAVSIVWARRKGGAGARSQRAGSEPTLAVDAHGYWVGMRGRF